MIKKHTDRIKIKVTSHMHAVKLNDKKVRAVTKKLIGKKISTLLLMLAVQSNNAAITLLKLIKSTIQNAKLKNIGVERIFLTQINIDKGPSRKKIFTRSRGRTNYIRKKTSHISIIITD